MFKLDAKISFYSIVFILSAGPLSAQIAVNELVRVRLLTSLSEIQISGQGIRIQGGASDYLKVAIPKADRVVIRQVFIEGKVFWQVKQQSLTKERFDLENEKATLYPQALLSVEGNMLSQGSLPLPSKLMLAQNGKGIDVIGVMALEDYLTGVLASEMPLRWPMESLKAQAVAARSYSLAVVKERRHQLFHLESNIKDQVFRHVVNGVDQDPLIERAVAAVRATQGMVLLDQKKKTLKAYYHADCGGKTSSAKAVWGYGDKGGNVVDQSCPSNPKANWSVRLSQKDISAKLAKLFSPHLSGGASLLAGIEPQQAGAEPRAEKIKLKFLNGEERTLLADKFRSIIGYSLLRSTKFSALAVSQNDQTDFVIEGKGFGHGVGLCQWGSRVLANDKQSFAEILKHYYPQASLSKK